MIELTIKQADLEKIAEKLKKLDIKDQGKALFTGFREAALLVERNLKLNVTGIILNVRSGRLRSSIGSMVIGEGDTLKAIIGSGVRQGNRVPYADIHESGGTITPKNKRFLTIPLAAAKTPAGVTRFTAAALMGGQTNYDGSFINKGIIYGKIGKKKIVPLFILKSSVRIPARSYMSRTLEQSSGEVVNTILKKIDEVLNQ